jgi:carotenoid cleavage dioxygenase-like enzyme
VVVDCVVFPDERAISGLTVANLRSDAPDLPRGDFVRFRLPLDGGTAERDLLFAGPVEFPTIAYDRYNGRPYRYAYLAATDHGGLPTAVAKVDLDGPTTHRWSEPGLHPGEAIFVPAPSPAAEDDGVLLSLALDGRAGRSVLLCLDAGTMTERARLPLPHRVPYGFHGQFYAATDPTRSMA